MVQQWFGFLATHPMRRSSDFMRFTVGHVWREARRATTSSMVGSLHRAWCSELLVTCCSSSVWAGEAGEEPSVVGSWGVDFPCDGGV
jgi:hypothetical protein